MVLVPISNDYAPVYNNKALNIANYINSTLVSLVNYPVPQVEKLSHALVIF